MFEKEAEESSKKAFCIAHTHEDELIYRNGFQQGAEFGYNKGKNEAIKHLKDLVYVVELGKNELATARIVAEAKEFLKETK